MRFKLFTVLLLANLLTTNIFAQKIDVKQNDLLNGRLYQEQRTNIEGHAFLLDNKFHLSNITYKGVYYKNLLIKYDLYNQQVIYYQKIDSLLPRFLLLNLDYLEKFEFEYNSTKYTFSSEFSDLNDLISDIKYYELIYDGTFKYIKGRIKEIDELAINNRIDKYVEKSYYYLVIDNKVHIIRNKRDFIKLFNSNKKELKKFIKSNNLNIKVWSYYDIIKLLVFCESLI